MSDLRELIDQGVRNHQTIAGMWYAVVTGPLPANENSALYVIIPGIDVNTKFGPCLWSPPVTKVMVDVAESADSGGNTEPANVIEIGRVKLPILGSECLVIFDNRQNVWVTQWA